MKNLTYAIMLSATMALPCIAPAHAFKEKNIIPWPSDLPVYDHIVIVIEENKDYEEVIGQKYAPYINHTLKAEGADFVQMYAEEHFSQGNYFWLFSGDNHNVGFVDNPPVGVPFSSPNLASQLFDKGLTFGGYVENLPANPYCTYGPDQLYARKHVPWISFSNVPISATMDFDEFPKDAAGFEKLPTVSFVIPNLDNDMHNVPPKEKGGTAVAVYKGDRWLKHNLDPYYQWAKKNNSLLIITFDENDDTRQYQGLTNPWFSEVGGTIDKELYEDLINRTITIFAGAHIKQGVYTEGRGITHVNILRTIESMYGLPKAGAQQHNAAGESLVNINGEQVAKKGISDDYIITDVFEKVK
jgi:phosphatidylinositol-3-phosphatase